VGWPAGLAFAFGSAAATSIGFLLRHRGAVDAPDVDAGRPLWSIRELFARKWWTIGFLVAVVAWTLHVTALKLAPLSLVQATLATGFVFLGVVAERFFGFELRRREWIGIGLTTAGLALLALTAADSQPGGAHSTYALGAAIAFEAGLVGCGALLLLSPRVGPMRDRRGPLLGAAAGLLFTVSHIGIKALAHTVAFRHPATLLNAWLPIVVTAAVVAFFASARSLQLGPAVPVIAITSAVSNVTAILAGIVVFGDPLGNTALLVALRIGAFVLVIVAAAMLPAPVRAAGAESSSPRGTRRTGQPVGAPG
jgi:drug/metabolite transporter (DMT)-like permease